MITESYVTFETAKLLKEAGFDCKVHKYFYRPRFSGKTTEIFAMPERNANGEARSVSCPTQSFAARWLREVHKIHLFANYFFEDCKWFYVTVDLKESDEVRAIHPNESNYETYEEALEAGLQEALRLIIKNKEDEKDNVQ